MEGATGGTRELPEGVDLDALRLIPWPLHRQQLNHLKVGQSAAHSNRRGGLCCPFIANPDLVERLRHGIELAVAPRESYYGGGAKGYTDWPAATSSMNSDGGPAQPSILIRNKYGKVFIGRCVR